MQIQNPTANMIARVATAQDDITSPNPNPNPNPNLTLTLTLTLT